MNIKWIFHDGNKTTECSTFPFAYRTMNNAWRRGMDGHDHNKNPCPRRSAADMAKSFSISGPHGAGVKVNTYSFTAAKEKARQSGLVDNEGSIDGREFKRRK